MNRLLEHLVGCAAAVALASNAHAVIYFVHPLQGNDSNTGTTWALAFQTLDKALTVAGGTSAVDQIWVVQGTYSPTTTLGGTTARHKTFYIPVDTAVYGGFVGPGAQFANGESSLAQRNPELNITILDGGLDANGDPNSDGIPTNNCYHVVTFWGSDALTTKLSGFTISNGYADGSGEDEYTGGGILVRFSNSIGGGAALNRLRIVNNYAEQGGGGLHAEGKARTYIANCSFENNSTGDFGFGGGVLVEEGDADLQNCVFWNNTATGGYGGGLATMWRQLFPNPEVRITNCTFGGNNAGFAGGAISSASCVGESAGVVLENSIGWDNSPDEIDSRKTASSQTQ